MGVEIIKTDIKEVAEEEVRAYCLLRNKGRIHRPWIKYKRKHEKTTPGGDVYNDLGCFFIQREKF
jgi:hypothetical protein